MALIIDYGAGNIASVSNMISYLGKKSVITSNYEEIENAEKIILPGVGSFDFGINALAKKNLIELLKKKISEEKIPVLGICLGMQLFCKESEEGTTSGLGIVDATVKRFRFDKHSELKVPHMGWNTVSISKKNDLFKKLEKKNRFYFVHSFYVSPNNNELAIGNSNYGSNFCAAYQKDNLFGVQFHPEKSHRFGMQLMNNFLSL